MARYFYAFRWAYGIGTTWDDESWPGGNDGSQDTH